MLVVTELIVDCRESDEVDYLVTESICQAHQQRPIARLLHRHRLREVSRLVDVRALEHRDVVRE